MKIFGVSIVAAAVIFLVGFYVAKQFPGLFGKLPILGNG